MIVNTTCLFNFKQPETILGYFSAIAIHIGPKTPGASHFKMFFAAIPRSTC